MRGRPQLRRRRADTRAMAVPALRRLVSSRALPAPRLDPETLTQLPTTLVDRRQQLRGKGAPAQELERNPLAVVGGPWGVSPALIERSLPPLVSPRAAWPFRTL